MIILGKIALTSLIAAALAFGCFAVRDEMHGYSVSDNWLKFFACILTLALLISIICGVCCILFLIWR